MNIKSLPYLAVTNFLNHTCLTYKDYRDLCLYRSVKNRKFQCRWICNFNHCSKNGLTKELILFHNCSFRPIF